MIRSALALAALAIASCTACSTNSAARGDADAMEVIPLQYVDATGTAERLQSDHPDVKIAAEPSTNSIIVAGSAADVDEVRRAVSRADQPG